MKSIAFIPHNQRIAKHKVQYLRAISDAMDHPWQAEDGRDLAPIQQQLADKCKSYSNINYWSFTDCCTDSLQIAIEALTEIGDRIIIPAYGWRAFANAPSIMGREIDFCDIDNTGNIDLNQLEDMIKTEAPKAVIIVHNFGTIVDVSKIANICKLYGVAIIEDAAPSFVMNEPYSYLPGTSSDIVCYSFDFTKVPGTLGSGGAIATNNTKIHDRIYEIQAHGINKSKNIISIGTKSFLDTTSCAVLLREMNIIETNNYREKRNTIAKWYQDNLPYPVVSGENYIWERYSLNVPEDEVESVLDRLHSVKCLARTMWKQPINTYPFFKNKKELPNVQKFVSSLIHLPSHHYLTNEELLRIKQAL